MSSAEVYLNAVSCVQRLIMYTKRLTVVRRNIRAVDHFVQRSLVCHSGGTEVAIGVGAAFTGRFYVVTRVIGGPAAHDPTRHGPGLVFVAHAIGSFHRQVPHGFGPERPVLLLFGRARRVALGVHHRVENERVARSRYADRPVAVLDSRAVGPVHTVADRHHARVQHGTAKLPEHRQLHREPGQLGPPSQVLQRVAERRTCQTSVQPDLHQP